MEVAALSTHGGNAVDAAEVFKNFDHIMCQCQSKKDIFFLVILTSWMEVTMPKTNVKKCWHQNCSSFPELIESINNPLCKQPELTFEGLIGENVSHGVMCPDYFAKGMFTALLRALSVPDDLFDILWDKSAGHGGDARIWFKGQLLSVELKWSSVANVGAQLGWQWKTTESQKYGNALVFLFAHKAFQPWITRNEPNLVKTAVAVDKTLENPRIHLSDHPSKWLKQTSMLIYDSTQFGKKKDIGATVPPAKLQIEYTRSFKGHEHYLHPKNVIVPCDDLESIHNNLYEACERYYSTKFVCSLNK